jgi:hypothetical protein
MIKKANFFAWHLAEMSQWGVEKTVAVRDSVRESAGCSDADAPGPCLVPKEIL